MVAVQEFRPRLPGDLLGLVRVAQESVQLLDEQDALLGEVAQLLKSMERLSERLMTAGEQDWRLEHLRHDLKVALTEVDTMHERTATRLAALGERH